MSDVSQQYNDVTKELYQNQLKLTEAQTKGEAASKGMDETYQICFLVATMRKVLKEA